MAKVPEAFAWGVGGSTVGRFRGVSLRDLARSRGTSPGRLVRSIRRALRGGRLRLVGLEAGSRLYVRPGRRALVHAAIAEAVLDGQVAVR